jgi:hypothetical protein
MTNSAITLAIEHASAYVNGLNMPFQYCKTVPAFTERLAFILNI